MLLWETPLPLGARSLSGLLSALQSSRNTVLIHSASQNNWRPQVHEGWLGTATQKVKSGWVLSWLLAWVPVPTQG